MPIDQAKRVFSISIYMVMTRAAPSLTCKPQLTTALTTLTSTTLTTSTLIHYTNKSIFVYFNMLAKDGMAVSTLVMPSRTETMGLAKLSHVVIPNTSVWLAFARQ